MGVSLKYTNPQEGIKHVKDPIFLNDLNYDTNAQREESNFKIRKEVAGDEYNEVPSCSCGYLHGRYRLGEECSVCNTIVTDLVLGDNVTKVWVRTPYGSRPFLHPMIHLQLYARLNRASINILSYVTDKRYKPPKDRQPATVMKLLNRLNDYGLTERGYNQFYDNFDKYIEVFLKDKLFVGNNKDTCEKLYNLIQCHKHILWQEFLPVPNKTFTHIEDTGNVKWVTKGTANLINIMRILIGCDSNTDPENLPKAVIRRNESLTARFLSKLSAYHDKDFLHMYLGRKQGLFRKHIYATRSDFGGRFVANAIDDVHDYDEFYFPWAGFITMFEPMILNKLLAKGYSPPQAVSFIYDHIRQYSKDLHDVINELIDEAYHPTGKRGIPMLLNRNPSLHHTSIVLGRVTRVKPNPTDNSFACSGTIMDLFNGDVDGDEINFKMVLDKRMADALLPFEPSFAASNITTPFEINGMISLPPQTALAIAMEGNNQDEECGVSDFLMQFAE